MIQTSPMIDNRLTRLFEHKKQGLLTVYFTAGFPNTEDTLPVLEALEKAGVDIVEIGMPFSDPIADGETIQQSNTAALSKGMSIPKLFEQLERFRNRVNLPVLLMGYINPVLQYGIENFCCKAAELGIDGLILPDLPLFEFEQSYKTLFEENNLSNVFLITPQTSEERIRQIDRLSQGFIYMVSTSSTTGKTSAISQEQEDYFERIRQMKLRNPVQIGFGISDRASFDKACQYASGAIIGSAFIKFLEQNAPLQSAEEKVRGFVTRIKN